MPDLTRTIFFGVEETFERFTEEQISAMVQEGARELPETLVGIPQIHFLPQEDDWHVEQRFGVPHIGRNEPCPCGRGKKFKKCHGAN
jgi:uncharacterized protein YecA (UPF0149 family)